MQILVFNQFSVYIYAGQVPPPHCHLRFYDGNDILLSIPNFKVLGGENTLDEDIINILLDNLDYICNKWDELN